MTKDPFVAHVALAPEAEILPVLLNGAVGARIVGTVDGNDTAISFVVEEGRISRIHAVRNPPSSAGSTSRRRSVASGLGHGSLVAGVALVVHVYDSTRWSRPAKPACLRTTT